MKKILLFIALVFSILKLSAQTFILSGVVKSPAGITIPNASVSLKNTPYAITCDSVGNYKITNIKRGNYTLQVSAVGYKLNSQSIRITEDVTLNLELIESVQQLNEVDVKAGKEKTFGVTRLKAVDGTNINAGKKAK